MLVHVLAWHGRLLDVPASVGAFFGTFRLPENRLQFAFFLARLLIIGSGRRSLTASICSHKTC